MEGQIHENSNKEITLNLDEFDIDSYDFKPVTKGLGFHEPKKKQSNFQRPPTPKAKPMARETRVLSSTVSHQMPKKDYLQNTPLSVSDPSLMSGIEALYKNQDLKAKKEVKKDEIKKVEPKIQVASVTDQFLAFFLDTFIVFLISSSLMLCFLYVAANSISYPLAVNFVKEMLPYVVTLTSLIFVTYFSLTEPVGTIGKRFLDLGTFHTKSNKRITIRMSFVRALITLFSFALLGLPMFLDFQGKLSDSRVLKN